MNPAGACCATGRPILLAVSLLLVACGHGSNAQRAAACKTVEPGRYFAVGTFAGAKQNTRLDQFTQRWFGRRLCAMGEEPLASRTTDEAYRLLWLRSFQDPVSVRVESSQAGALLVAVELDGSDALDPTDVRRRTERRLGAGEWAALAAALKAAAFWDMPVEDPAEPRFDGSMWVLEGKRGGAYHVVERQSPGGNAFRAAGEAFLVASRFSFPANEGY